MMKHKRRIRLVGVGLSVIIFGLICVATSVSLWNLGLIVGIGLLLWLATAPVVRR